MSQAPLIILTPEQLEELVRKAVRAEMAANDGDPGEVLDVYAAASEAKRSPRTVRRAAAKGELGKKVRGEWRFTRAEVRSWARPGGTVDKRGVAVEAARRLLSKG